MTWRGLPILIRLKMGRDLRALLREGGIQSGAVTMLLQPRVTKRLKCLLRIHSLVGILEQEGQEAQREQRVTDQYARNQWVA